MDTELLAKPETPRLEPEQRKSALANAVANDVRLGWNVQSQTDYQAVMVRHGTRVNHILHLILTIITLGLWAVVWILLAVFRSREKRMVIGIDEYGNLTRQYS